MYIGAVCVLLFVDPYYYQFYSLQVSGSTILGNNAFAERRDSEISTPTTVDGFFMEPCIATYWYCFVHRQPVSNG
jgi:hypothetical protein